MFRGPAEADETFVGSRRKRETLEGRAKAGKAAVAGVQVRETDRVAARRMKGSDAGALQGFARERVEPGGTLCADRAGAGARIRKTGEY